MYKYVLQVQKKTTRIASRASCFIKLSLVNGQSVTEFDYNVERHV